MFFRLNGIEVGIGHPEKFDSFYLYFNVLPFALTLHKKATEFKGCSGMYLAQLVFIERLKIYYTLQIG